MSSRILVGALVGVAVGLCVVAGCATGPPSESYPPCGEPGWLSAEQIEAMPLLERPDRPGHCFGNTIRAIDRWLNGDPSADDCNPCP